MPKHRYCTTPNGFEFHTHPHTYISMTSLYSTTVGFTYTFHQKRNDHQTVHFLLYDNHCAVCEDECESNCCRLQSCAIECNLLGDTFIKQYSVLVRINLIMYIYI